MRQLCPVAATAGSAQELWLKADLAANSTKNVIALWHKPRYSSGATNLQALQPLWDDLYAAGVDILLDGHDHIYERTAPMKSGATPAVPARCRPDLRHPTVHRRHGRRSPPWPRPHPLPTSEVRNDTTFGIFKLTLHATTLRLGLPADRRQHLHRLRHRHRARCARRWRVWFVCAERLQWGR